MHTLILIAVAIFVLVLGFTVGLCITAKRADEAIAQAIKDFSKEKQ